MVATVNLAVELSGARAQGGPGNEAMGLAVALTAGRTQEIHLNPNKLAKYDTVAKVLADAQRLAVKKIGFTGLDQYMQ